MREQMDVITTNDMVRWNKALMEVGSYDFHHLPQYHRLAEMRGEGDGYLLAYHADDCLIIFPLLVKNLHLPASEKHGYKDATSVHGYSGPLCSKADVSPEVVRRFLEHLTNFYKENSIVTAFSRLHPLFEQEQLLAGCGEVSEVGVTLSMDLTQSPADQRSAYRKSHRYEIERLKKNGFTCREVGSERLDEFVRIYIQTMLDLHADEFYLYDRTYFEYLMREMADVIHLFMCMDGNEVACVGLFAVCQGIIQYHLAGTSAAYRKMAPMKLLLDTVREWGNSISANRLHLGGGLGAKRDSLYEFKVGFGSTEHAYKTWRMVVDPIAYEGLCSEAKRLVAEKLDDNYFPAYRNPLLHEIISR